MVASKRCKICAVLDEKNVPIRGDYFGKAIPEVIFKICGVELDARKTNDVLICQPCAIQLVHTDAIIDKLRNAVQRLKKNVKVAKPKTPKNGDLNKSASENVEQTIEFDGSQCKSVKDCGPADKELKTPKKIVRRKSVFLDEKLPNANNGVKQNENSKKSSAAKRKCATSISESHKSITFSNTSTDTAVMKRNRTISIREKSPLDLALEEAIKFDKNELKSATNSAPVADKDLNTPKAIKRRKSVFLDEAINGIKRDDNTISEEEMRIKKSPGAKRKSTSSISETNKNVSLFEPPINSTVMKRTKTASIREESVIDSTIDEQNANDTNNEACVEQIKEKAMNCILCDKIFRSKRTLRDHIETAHMGERLKACPHCSSEFRSLQKYESHVFSEKCKSANHQCQHPNCSKRFKTIHKMELHMHEKHSSQN